MDFVPAVQWLMEWPEDLEGIKTDVQKLCVYSSALQILPNWLDNMVNLQELILDGGNNAGTNDFLQPDQDQTFLCEDFFEIVCNSPQYFRAAVLGFYSHFKLYLAIFT